MNYCYSNFQEFRTVIYWESPHTDTSTGIPILLWSSACTAIRHQGTSEPRLATSRPHGLWDSLEWTLLTGSSYVGVGAKSIVVIENCMMVIENCMMVIGNCMPGKNRNFFSLHEWIRIASLLARFRLARCVSKKYIRSVACVGRNRVSRG